MFRKNVYRTVIEIFGWITAIVLVLGLLYLAINLIVMLLPILAIIVIVAVAIYTIGVFRGKKR